MGRINKQQADQAFLLLPWYITGKLSEEQQQIVEQALPCSPELQQEYEQQQQLAQMICEDHDILNVTAISSQEQRLERLLERINQEGIDQQSSAVLESKSTPEHALLTGWALRIEQQIRSFALLFSTHRAQVALALFVVVQVAIVSLVFNTYTGEPSDTVYELATEDNAHYVASDKTILILYFTRQADEKAIKQLFQTLDVQDVDHPQGSAYFEVTLSRLLSDKELDNLISDLEKKKDLVLLVGEGL